MNHAQQEAIERLMAPPLKMTRLMAGVFVSGVGIALIVSPVPDPSDVLRRAVDEAIRAWGAR